jgi:hypothetical protein
MTQLEGPPSRLPTPRAELPDRNAVSFRRILSYRIPQVPGQPCTQARL